jgi:hypothetical protein
MVSSRSDEIFVETFLRSRGFVPTRLDGSRRDSSRKPDFHVEVLAEAMYFFCEVKSICIETFPDGLFFQRVNNRLTSDIRNAADQFRSVNPTHAVPNVLFWISHNFQINVHSLVDLLIGGFWIETQLISDFRRYILGRVHPDISEIDLHVWLPNDGTPQYVVTNGAHVEQVTRAFGIVTSEAIQIQLARRSEPVYRRISIFFAVLVLIVIFVYWWL